MEILSVSEAVWDVVNARFISNPTLSHNYTSAHANTHAYGSLTKSTDLRKVFRPQLTHFRLTPPLKHLYIND